MDHATGSAVNLFERRSRMIPIAIFPCSFTDGARVLGELSYTLSIPIYTDQRLLQKIADTSLMSAETLRSRLFSRAYPASRRSFEKERLINLVRQHLEAMRSADEQWLYYGYFTSLLESGDGLINKILIIADQDCRVQRAMRQEGLSESRAQALIQENDETAACWTQFLFSSSPYHPELYDTVIRYECQDLLDVVASIFMQYEEVQPHGLGNKI